MTEFAKITRVRGVELVYSEAGEGPAVMLLHGFPFDRSMWRDQIEFLRDSGFRAIAPDLRGLGQTRWNGSVAGMDEMARDVAALIDRLRIDGVVLCGLSMGCYVAFEFVHLFPEQVKGLVLAGGRAQGADDDERKSREEQARRVLEQGMGFAVDSILNNLLASRTLAAKPDVVLRVGEMVRSTDPRGAAAAQRGMAMRRDFSADLARIGVPTLIIAGKEDSVRKPEDAEFIHSGIMNSRLEVIDDAGHLMNMEQPEVFNQALLEFLSKLIH